jgi:peroxiredoxin Q/BCP
MLAPGTLVDDFTLTDDQGRSVRWADLRGSAVVVFAFPKASTPGCTKEACAFRDLAPEFSRRRVKVLGLSADTEKAQAGFRHKYALSMPLLCDPEHRVLEAWGIWGEKTMYGRTMKGIRRTTFLFDAHGVVRFVWANVKVDGHAEKVLAKIDEASTP